MYKSVAILFLACFSCYILFTRTPDYFDSEFTPGTVVLPDTADWAKKAVVYPVGKEKFTVPIEGWGSSQVAKGDKVTVIYNPTNPSEGAMYTFFSYWLKLPELLISATIFLLLFFGAVFITGENQPEEPDDGSYKKKRKYKD
ncbi:DUF3592 domain-containing protein [Aridibaculum aurantiacum]|uniref:DUF3592 domain-containing protein n=1 Tax=Aridibaculum aurantiacum TaxID=2810307 RepID=UPI001A974F62|nr:DUF3592 domain-containing protein [Aridibaculum aurantiacum]